MAMLVCNPATQELVVLPPGSGSGPCPRSTESTAAVGFDCVAEQSHNDPPVYNIGHEIFTLDTGAGDGWQRMQDQSRAISPGGRRPAACTRGGFFYWFINDSQPCTPLWFSLRDEAFDAVPSSLGCTACDNNDRLADLTGELCYVHRVRTSVATHEVWMAVAVDDDDQEWWLRYRVDLGGGNSQRWFYNFSATAAGDDGVEEEATLVAILYKELWWHRERSKQL
uniref:F-box associated beta-propeller type 3 domain-containing protein n=1 Tax=Oryza glumipatula TaxID=40148 RepID=A0A0D9YYA7_9ORYZ